MNKALGERERERESEREEGRERERYAGLELRIILSNFSFMF
jgi:hypothetical protein